MGRRFDTLVFPGGKKKAFTLSYDDGVIQDRRLAELLRSHGLKCSFNLNSGLMGITEIGKNAKGEPMDVSKIPAEEIPAVCRGHEICGHGLYHPDLAHIGTPMAMYEIIEDKRRLEQLSGQPLKTFAYPYGTVSDEVVELLRLAGYQGARTVWSTHRFDLPEDFLRWNPTCHHADPRLMELAREFAGADARFPMLFYVWGHSYELDGDDNWQVLEELAAFMGALTDTWFATNGEITDYVNAYRRLEYSADGLCIRNPSAMDVTIRTSWDTDLLLPAGTLTRLERTFP